MLIDKGQCIIEQPATAVGIISLYHKFHVSVQWFHYWSCPRQQPDILNGCYSISIRWLFPCNSPLCLAACFIAIAKCLVIAIRL